MTMALYEKEWWRKLWQKKSGKRKVDVVKDISAIRETLLDLDADVKTVLSSLEKLEELEKEFTVAHSDEIITVNLSSQEKILTNLLERYEFLQNDVDINGLRVKRIANEFLKRASKADLKELVKEKKKDARWLFQW